MIRPPDTAGRLRRLLAALAWLAQIGEAPVDEVADRFGLTSDELVAELELAACCGVPPYTPDQLMEIVVSDSTVSVRPGIALARPRRLSPHEGFALAASARALLAVDGSDPTGALSSALAKLEGALGGAELGVELDTPAFFAAVVEALERNRALMLTYYSASTDRVTDRRVHPRRIFASEGHWYLDAWCELAGDLRRFRVDRITAVEAKTADGTAVEDADAARGVEIVRPADQGGPTDPSATDADVAAAFVPAPDHRRVRLSVEPSAAWLFESIPAAGPPVPSDGRVEVEVFVAGEAWLERLLLRLGPEARVIDPPELRGVGTIAARRILDRYEPER